MKHVRSLSGFLPASSLALLFSLIFGSAGAQVPVESDPTYDVVADDPAVAQELREKELEMEAFFEQRDVEEVRGTVLYTPEASAREEMQLLERAEREMGEFRDIDGDDLAAIDQSRQMTGQPRLEKPGQLEKEAPVLDCPAGTVASVDACVAVLVED